MTTTVEKFMFETTFDEMSEPEIVVPEPEDEEKEEEPEIIVPTFSEEELNAAREEGFAAGKQEGQQETSVSVEARIAELLSVIETKCQDVFQMQIDGNVELSRGAVTIASEVVHKVVPSLVGNVALDEIERVIQSIFEKIVEEPRVTIFVSAELVDDLRARIENMSKSRTYEGNMHVQGDDTMPTGDCRLEWSNGGTERNSVDLWSDIDTIIDSYLDGKPTIWSRSDEPASDTPNDTQDPVAETQKTELDSTVEMNDPAPEIQPEADE